jgi:hypothetical protein
MGVLPYLSRQEGAMLPASEDVTAVTDLRFVSSSFFGRRVIFESPRGLGLNLAFKVQNFQFLDRD